MDIDKIKIDIWAVLFTPSIIILAILFSPVVKRRNEDLSKQIPKRQSSNLEK